MMTTAKHVQMFPVPSSCHCLHFSAKIHCTSSLL